MFLYLTDAERVWKRLKNVAAHEPEAITPHNAYAIVENVIADEQAQSIPQEARTYFARELHEMVCSQTQNVQQQPRTP